MFRRDNLLISEDVYRQKSEEWHCLLGQTIDGAKKETHLEYETYRATSHDRNTILNTVNMVSLKIIPAGPE